MSTQASDLAPALGRALTGLVGVSEHRTDQRIIDAVLAELRVTALGKLSLEDVARRAGVTRMTIYRRFGDRERLIEATFARELSRLLDIVSAEMDREETPAERVAVGFAAGLRLAHGHPVVAHWLATSPGELLNTFLADDGFLVDALAAFLAGELAAAGGPDGSALRWEGDTTSLAEVLARLTFALLLIPPKSVDLTDPEQAGSLARALIAPLIPPTEGG